MFLETHISPDSPPTEISGNLANYIKGNSTGTCKFDADDRLLKNMYLYACEIGQNKPRNTTPIRFQEMFGVNFFFPILLQ